MVRIVDGRHGRAMDGRQCARDGSKKLVRSNTHYYYADKAAWHDRHQVRPRPQAPKSYPIPRWNAGHQRIRDASRAAVGKVVEDVTAEPSATASRLLRGARQDYPRTRPDDLAPTLVIVGAKGDPGNLEGNTARRSQDDKGEIVSLEAATSVHIEHAQGLRQAVLES